MMPATFTNLPWTQPDISFALTCSPSLDQSLPPARFNILSPTVQDDDPQRLLTDQQPEVGPSLCHRPVENS